jgi:hypothetical protein
MREIKKYYKVLMIFLHLPKAAKNLIHLTQRRTNKMLTNHFFNTTITRILEKGVALSLTVTMFLTIAPGHGYTEGIVSHEIDTRPTKPIPSVTTEEAEVLEAPDQIFNETLRFIKDQTDKKDFPLISEPDADKSEEVFGVRPVESKFVNGMTTGNSFRTTTAYYDADDNLIGTKDMASFSDPFGNSWRDTKITWKDTQGTVVLEETIPVNALDPERSANSGYLTLDQTRDPEQLPKQSIDQMTGTTSPNLAPVEDSIVQGASNSDVGRVPATAPVIGAPAIDESIANFTKKLTNLISPIPFGGGELKIEKEDDLSKITHYFVRLYTPGADQPFEEFEIIKDFNIKNGADFKVITADTVDGKKVKFYTQLSEGKSVYPRYTVSENISSQLFLAGLKKTKVFYFVAKSQDRNKFKLGDILLKNENGSEQYSKSFIYSDKSGDLVTERIAYSLILGNVAPHLIEVTRHMTIPPSSDLMLQSKTGALIFDGSVSSVNTTHEPSGLITGLTASTSDHRQITVTVTREEVKVNIKTDTQSDSKVLFFDPDAQYESRGSVRFSADVSKDDIYAYFSSLDGVQANRINYNLNLWHFSVDKRKNIFETLSQIASDSRVRYVLPVPKVSFEAGQDSIEEPGMLITRLKDGVSVENFEIFLKTRDAVVSGSLVFAQPLTIQFDPQQATNQEVIKALQESGLVEYAEPNIFYTSNFSDSVEPFKISAATSPGFSDNLFVDVFKDGSANVKWRNDTLSSIYDSDTQTITMSFDKEGRFLQEIWTVNIGQKSGTGSEYFIKSFHRTLEKSDNSDSDVEHYQFSETGLLMASESITSDSRFVIEDRVKTFYAYDDNRKLITKLRLQNGSTNRNPRNNAEYSLRNHEALKSTDVELYDLDDEEISDLMSEIDSANQYELLEPHTITRTENYYQDSDFTRGLFSIVYLKNETENFSIPKLVKKGFKTFIVQGVPDVISEESDDILFEQNQEVDSFNVWFGEHVDIDGNRVYGLGFYEEVKVETSGVRVATQNLDEGTVIIIDGKSYTLVAFVNFPSETQVTLNDIQYQIQIDATGIMILNETNLQDPVNQITQVTVSDLVDTFGFTRDKLESLMDQGLITIDVNLEDLSVTIHIADKVQKSGLALWDPLGEQASPGEIIYQLGLLMSKCPESACAKSYHPEFARFNIGNQSFELDYGTRYHGDVIEGFGDDRVHYVTVSEDGKTIKKMQIVYEKKQSALITITYLDSSEDNLSSRDVTITRMADGLYHIKEVEDLDTEGNVIAISEFAYGVFIGIGFENSFIPTTVSLIKITRTNQNGNVLSTITGIRGNQAVITLASNSEGKEVQFESFEDLLLQAREMEHQDSPEVRAVKALVTNDLINTFGFARDELQNLMDRGLITIEVNLEDLSVTVTIDESVQTPKGTALWDPLGEQALPREINYQVEEVPSPIIGYHFSFFGSHKLISGSFHLKDGSRVELEYPQGFSFGPNPHSVKIYDANETLVKKIGFKYKYESIFLRLPSKSNLIATITYFDNSQGDVASREVTITRMADGLNHIKEVVDRNAFGNVIATSEFSYGISVGIGIVNPNTGVSQVKGWSVSLILITRTDKDGNLLSTITGIRGNQAVITLPNGDAAKVQFESFESLLLQARILEQQDPDLDNLFSSAQNSIDQLQSGEEITIDDAEALRAIQEQLKAEIENLPENEQDQWVKKFNEYLKASDGILQKALRVVLDDGTEIIVRNPTQLMTDIIRRFKLMDQDGDINLARFAGIDQKDLEEIETLLEYLNARKIGDPIDLPVFNLVSPLGNLELINRLVRKYHEATEIVGPVVVVDPADFLRFIDGTKPAFDNMVEIAKGIFTQYPVGALTSPLTLDKIKTVLEEIATLNNALVENILAELSKFEGEDVFKNILINEITAAIQSGNNGLSSYSNIWKNINNALRTLDIVYFINGQEVYVSRAELDSFANFLPADSANLLRYPGIADDIKPDFFNDLIARDFYNNLGRFSLLTQNTDTDNTSAPIFFSFAAKRFQLLQIFLETWGSEVMNTDGTVHFDQLRYRMVISKNLEIELENAEQFLDEQIDTLLEFADKEEFTPEDYEAMKELLKEVREKLLEQFQPLLDDIIFSARNEVMARVNDRYQKLVAVFDSVLKITTVTVEIQGYGKITFDPTTLGSEVLDKILNATAIQINGFFQKDAFLRLTGVNENMLGALLSPSQLNRLRQFNFNSQDDWSVSSTFAHTEILFRLLPQIVNNFRTSDTDQLMAHLTEGVVLQVPLGEVLKEKNMEIVRELSSKAYEDIENVSVETMEDLLALRDIFKQLNANLKEQLSSLARDLSSTELSYLENWMNNQWGEANLKSVQNLFDQKVNNVQALEINGVIVPIRQILQIAGFPSSNNFDNELFPEITADDTADAETNTESAVYRTFRFKESQESENPWLTPLGRIQVIANIIARLLSDPDLENSDIFFTDDGVRKVDPETLRKHLKGVAQMQESAIKEARQMIEAVVARLEAMRKSSYTIEEIEALYEQVLELRTALIEMLDEITGKHEKRDVVEVENPISLIFQDLVFDLFTSMVSEADLAVEVDGAVIVVPAKEITDALTDYLKENLDEDIAAHHFATFYGISVGDIREVHKLEQFFSEQMVVLPRNSEFIEIVSRISELGFMQLAALLVKRHQADIINENGEVNVSKLIDMLTNKGAAVDRVKQNADEVYKEALSKLQALEGPFDLNALTELLKVMEDAQIDLVSLMNDFVSSLGDSEVVAELEIYINSLYRKLKIGRNTILENNLLVLEIEGQTFVINNLAERVTEFVNFMALYTLNHPPNDTDQLNQFETKLTRLLMPPQYSNSKLIGLPISIWFPQTRDYDPEQHPTDFGMTVLFARLVAKYGTFVFAKDANGEVQFDMGLFLQELQKTDQDRAERRLDAILKEKLPEMNTYLDSIRDADGALPIDRIDEINQRFLEIKTKVQQLGSDAPKTAREVWVEFIALYEKALFDGRLSAEVDGVRFTFEPKVLDEILMALYEEGKLHLKLLEMFRDMIQQGETTWNYKSFKNLYFFRMWIDRGLKRYGWNPKSLVATSDDDRPDLNSAAGNFTLGDLESLAGINRNDLNNLDVAEKDGQLQITPVDPLKLIGLLDMRSLAPGSGIDAGNLLTARASNNSTNVSQKAVFESAFFIESPISFSDNLSMKSFRFRVFELIPELIRAMGVDNVVGDGSIDSERFKAQLQKDPEQPIAIQNVQNPADQNIPSAITEGAVLTVVTENLEDKEKLENITARDIEPKRKSIQTDYRIQGPLKSLSRSPKSDEDADSDAVEQLTYLTSDSKKKIDKNKKSRNQKKLREATQKKRVRELRRRKLQKKLLMLDEKLQLGKPKIVSTIHDPVGLRLIQPFKRTRFTQPLGMNDHPTGLNKEVGP